MPFVSITRLRVRSWRYLPAFLIHAFSAAWQAKAAPTSIAVSLLRDANRTFWTRTLWNEEAAMRSFMLSGPHRRVMPRLLEWCDEASVVNWMQDSREASRAGKFRQSSSAVATSRACRRSPRSGRVIRRRQLGQEQQLG
jgi:hypothetical protein